MKRYSDLNREQLTQRASDKLEGLLFFAHKNLQELELKLAGVLPSQFDEEDILNMIQSSCRELDTLNLINELIEDEIIYNDAKNQSLKFN